MDRVFWFSVAGAIAWPMAIAILTLIRCLWWRPLEIQRHLELQGVIGPPYKLLMGNAKEMMDMMKQASSSPMDFSHDILPRVLSFYHHWTKIYGRTFVLWFGPTARINVTDPELVKEIFYTKFEDYEKAEAHPLVKKLEGDGLLSLSGDKWAHHRRIINPAFHMENLNALIPVIADSIASMLEKWRKNIELGANEIEVSGDFQNLSADIIARAAFGSSYEEGKHLFNMQAEQMIFAAEAFHKIILPGCRFLPTRKNKYQWKLDKEIKRSLVKIIQKREQDSGIGKLFGTDLLSRMLRAKAKCTQDSKNNDVTGIRIQDILEECKTFFFAGRQTTSNMLTWTIVLLAMHQEWQQIARNQVLELCGENVPHKDNLNRLKILDMILNESLRLYPPIVAAIRRTNKEIKLGRLKLPKGMELMVPILAIHHDQTLWGDDVNQFNPTRFCNGVAKAAKHPMAFIPFGVGPRTCIGQNFALMEAKLALAMILQRFSFGISASYRHAPTVLMMLYPQHGAQIIFHERLIPPSNVP